jgi:hypothetical protein
MNVRSYVVSSSSSKEALFLGIFKARDEQHARDLCAKDAGYKNEAHMIEFTEQPSKLFAAALDD